MDGVELTHFIMYVVKERQRSYSEWIQQWMNEGLHRLMMVSTDPDFFNAPGSSENRNVVWTLWKCVVRMCIIQESWRTFVAIIEQLGLKYFAD